MLVYVSTYLHRRLILVEKRTRLSKEDRKQQILDAAKEVFIEKGYASTTTASIAKQADVSEVTLFRYFSSKHEVFDSVIQPILNAPLQETQRLDTSDSKQNQVYALINNRIEFINQNQGVIKLLLIEHDRFDLKENYIKKMSEHMKNQMIDLEIDFNDYHMRLFMGMLLSFLYFPAKNIKEKDEFIKSIVGFLVT